MHPELGLEITKPLHKDLFHYEKENACIRVLQNNIMSILIDKLGLGWA